MTALGTVICVRKDLGAGIQNLIFIKWIKKYSLPVTTVKFSKKGGGGGRDGGRTEIWVQLSQNVKFECLQAVNSREGVDWQLLEIKWKVCGDILSNFTCKCRIFIKINSAQPFFFHKAWKIEDWDYFLSVIKMKLIDPNWKKPCFAILTSVFIAYYIQECRVTFSKASKIFHWPEFKFSWKVCF